jgi:hypothetical protein
MDFELLRDRRVVIAAACGAVALFAALGIGVGLMVRHHGPSASEEAPSGAPSLQVEMGKEDTGLDTSKPLRCYVGGQFVGMATLADCAKKNGAPASSLDVGLDQSGQAAAAAPGGSALVQSSGAPPASDLAPGSDAAAIAELQAAGAKGSCWRFSGGWSKLSDEMSLDGCVRALFAGHCQPPGAVDYGRWNGDTLRLSAGSVEIAADNRTFHALVKQSPQGCTIPNLQE